MDFKKLISQLDQLNEADVKHKGTYGTSYQGDDDKDDDKKTASASTEKRGRGRPKKAGGDEANAAGYSGAKDLQSMMVGNIPKDSKQLKNLPKTKNKLSDEEPKKKKSTTESLKDWIAMIDEQRMLAEEGITVKPMQGASQLIGADGKPMGTADAATANMIKQASEKGTLKFGSDEGMQEGDIGKHNNATTGFDALVRKLTPKYGKEAATRIAGSQMKKIKEAALPTHDGDAGAGLGAGRSNYALEGAQGVAEAKNHMGETEYNTYAGWKAACRKAGADKFEGDRDICQAMKDGKGMGEWDGASGSVYDDSHKKKKMAEGQSAKRDNRAEAAGKKVTKDLEYDMKHKGKDDNKAERAGKKVTKDIEYDEKKTPPMAHIKKMCKDGKTVAQICKMHPNCNQAELKKMVADCKKKMVKEGQTPMKNIFVILDDNLIDQIKRMNGAVLDPDAGTVETWDENTFNQLNAFAQKNPTRLKRAQSMNTAGMRPMARQVGGTAYGPEYNLKEGLDQRLEAARSEGRAHGLRGHQHCGNNYDDMEEARCYHEGYKEGLDECYGIMPLRGVVGEKSDQGIMDTMDYDAEELDEMDRRSFLNTAGTAVAGLAGVAALGGMSGNAQAAPKDAFGAMDSLDNSPIGKERDRVDLQANEFANRYPKFRTEYEGIRNRFRRDAEKVSAAEHMRPSMTDQAKANYIRTLTGIYQSYINQLTAAMKHFNTMQEGELDEMNKTAYMKQQARKSPGKTFNAFGQTFHDSDVLDEFAFESLDRQLNALLSEGMTVSISKGQENSPDSVSINASDAEADSLLAFVKQAGLGIFGGDDHGGAQDAVVTSAPSIASSDAIEVVDDHDGMLSLIRKMAGQGAAQPAHDHSSEDYADEEETCNECGMAYESCGGNHGGEMVDEMESEDQMTYNVAEDNPPDTGAAETEQEVQDTAQANSSAASFDQAQAGGHDAAGNQRLGGQYDAGGRYVGNYREHDRDLDEEEEEGGHDAEGNLYPGGLHDVAGHYVGRDRERDDRIKGRDLDDELEESYANSADDTFESDIVFMTNIISGGANGPKSTGQTTIPVVSTQFNRLGSPMKESTDLLTQWKKLSGLK